MASNDVGSTGDYATLATWEAARQGSNDATETAVLLSEDHANDAGATIDGWTGTCEHVEITGAVAQDGDITTGARYQGRSSNGYVVVAAEASIAVDISDISVEVTGGFYIGLLQHTDGATYDNALRFSISRCLVVSTVDNFGVAGVQMNVRSTNMSAANRIGLDVDNCVFAGLPSTSWALELGYSGGPRQNMDVIVRGSTFYNAQSRVGSSHSTSTTSILFRGCLFRTPASADAFTDDTSGGTYSITSEDCLGDETSATHSADFSTVTNYTEVTFNDSGTPAAGEVSFTDAANDDYSLVDNANNEALAYVTSGGSMPSDDILGTTRDATPDAGAFEVVTAGDVTVDVPTDSVTVASPTPTVENNVVVAVPTSSATVEEPTPTVTTTEHVVVAVPTDTVTVDSPVPTVTTTESVTVSVPADTVTIDSPTPTVTTSEDITVSVPTDTVTIDSPIPTVTTTEGVTIDVPSDTVTIDSPIPVIDVPVTIDVPTSTVTIGDPVPTVGVDRVIEVPAPGTVTIEGPIPTISSTIPASIITVIPVDQVVQFDEGDEVVLTLTGPSATDPKVRIMVQFLQDDPRRL